MIIVDISKIYPIVNHFMRDLRDVDRQRDNLLFRERVSQLGEILSLEASKRLNFMDVEFKTPFGECTLQTIESNVIMIAIVRAGIQLMEGAYRLIPTKHSLYCACEKNELGIREDSLLPDIDISNVDLFICEPLMASASSVIACLKSLRHRGQPRNVFILNVVTTELAIENISKLPESEFITLYTCSKDKFTPGIRGTRPGVGDIGNLLYGIK